MRKSPIKFQNPSPQPELNKTNVETKAETEAKSSKIKELEDSLNKIQDDFADVVTVLIKITS